ncbi:Nn.00g072900.m01.CDS01 [Neocucurbitaria sp. VM-36]
MPLVRPPPPSTSSPSPTSQKKQLPTFAKCPRTNYVAGKDDWMQITSPKPFPDFDICPTCYSTSFRNTRYGPCISTIQPKPETISTRCDFSDLWNRIAYAYLFTQNAPDLTLMGSVAGIQHDEYGACPNLNHEDPEVQKGRKPAVMREWYCLYDPKTNSLVEDLTVCSDCVAHVNLIFPCLSGIFCPVANGQRLLATCDLMMLGKGQARSLEYLDRLIEVAEKALKDGARDVSSLVEYVRRWAPIPFCPKGELVAGEKRYSLSSTVPEFTACEECYTKYIHPLFSNSPQPRILSQLDSSIPPTNTGFTCDLYSPRLQQYFRDASTTNDLQGYRQKLVARNAKMQEMKIQIRNMQQEYRQLKTQSEMHMNMMQLERVNAITTNVAWTVSNWSAPPADWRASNAQMNHSHQLALQAAMRLDNIKLLEQEWEEYWE